MLLRLLFIRFKALVDLSNVIEIFLLHFVNLLGILLLQSLNFSLFLLLHLIFDLLNFGFNFFIQLITFFELDQVLFMLIFLICILFCQVFNYSF